MAFLPETGRHAVEHVSRRHVPDHGSLLAPVAEHVIIQKDEDVVRVQIASGIIDHAEPVGVSVRGHADVEAVIHDLRAQLPHRHSRRRRHPSAEQRIVRIVHHFDIAPGRKQKDLQRDLRNSEHRVKGDAQIRFPDRFHIDLIQDVIQILVDRINLPDQPLPQRLFILHLGDRVRIQPFRYSLDLIRNSLVRVPAALGKYLDSVIDGRIVAGCHHHAVGQLMAHHIKHNERRR